MFGGKIFKKILDTLRQSLANNFPKNIDDTIVHVFSIAFYKTGNHNRHNVLGKILYNVSGSCFDTKQQIILPVLAIYIRYFSCSAIVLYTNISQYHYSFLAKKTLGLLCFNVLQRTIVDYYFIMFCTKSSTKQCLRVF